MSVGRFFSRAVSAVSTHCTISEGRLKELLKDVAIEVVFEEACVRPSNASITMEALVNLLSRFYPTLCFSGSPSLVADATSMAKTINPKIDILTGVSSPTVKIIVGGNEPDGDAVVPSASGWVVSLSPNRILKQNGPINPFASGVAACLAAAETFRRVFSSKLPTTAELTNITFSLLDFSEEKGIDLAVPPTDLGEVAFFGLGAVGNATIWCLSRLPGVSGTPYLVDHEDVELSNLQRYMLTTDKDVKTRKTEIALRELSATSMRPQVAPVKLEEFADAVGSPFMIPTICVSVDNFEGRRNAQALLPKLVVNGYTGERDLGISWHRFGRENSGCLACLYQGDRGKSELEEMRECLGLTPELIATLLPPDKRLTKAHVIVIEKHCRMKEGSLRQFVGKHLKEAYVGLVCGSMAIEVARDKKEVVPLAHQSAMAGFLLAAELVKRLNPSLELESQQSQLVIWGNILSAQRADLYDNIQTNGCLCMDTDYLSFFEKKWQQ